MTRPWICALLAAALAAGCAGYKLGPTNSALAGQTVAIRPFVNKTHEPRVTEYLAMALRRQLQQDGTFRLETAGSPDIILSGEITHFDRAPLSYTTNDVLTPQEYSVRMEVRVVARNAATGRTMLDRQIADSTFMRIGEDLGSAEREAMPVLTDQVARDAINQLVDGSW